MKMTYTSPEMKLIGFAAAESLASSAVDFDNLLTQDQYGQGTEASANDINMDLDLDMFN